MLAINLPTLLSKEGLPTKSDKKRYPPGNNRSFLEVAQ